MDALKAARQMLAGSPLDVRTIQGLLTVVRAPSDSVRRPQAPVRPVGPTPTYRVEDVVVTGYAAGLGRSHAAKRDADVVSDVVTGDDQGDLPSNNLAETLARIAGVNAVRNHNTGEGDRVTIRGLATELNGYELDGLRLAGAGSREDRFYRGLRTSILPADGATAVSVIKSLTPDRNGEGVGGVIDLRTPNAFDTNAPRAALAMSTGVLDKFDHPDSWSASATFSRRFGGHWGIHLDGSWSERRSQFQFNGADGDNQPPVWYADSDTVGWDVSRFVMGGMEIGFGDTEVRRTSLAGSLDYRDAAHSFHLRARHNAFEQDEFLNRLNLRNETTRNSMRLVQVRPSATGLGQPEDMIVGHDPSVGRVYAYSLDQIIDRDGDGRITDADRATRSFYSLAGSSGVWDPRDVGMRRYWEAERESGALTSINFGGQSSVAGLSAGYDLAWSRATDDLDAGYRLEFRGSPADAVQGLQVAPDGDQRFPLWGLSAAGMADVQNTSLFTPRSSTGQVGGARETLTQGRLNLEWRSASGALTSIKGGAAVSHSRRSAHSGSFSTPVAGGALSDLAPLHGPYVGTLFGGRYSGLYGLGVTLDSRAVLREFERARTGSSDWFAGPAASPSEAVATDAGRFLVQETSFSGFLMASASFGAADLIGGMRLEHVRTLVDAYRADPIKGSGPAREHSGYTLALPSLHLKHHLGRDSLVRAAVWTSYARPDVARMTAPGSTLYAGGMNADGRPTVAIVRTGAARLKPVAALNYDLSLERYAGRYGAYSIAAFYKDLDHAPFRWSSINVREGTLSSSLRPDGTLVLVPADGGRGEVYGVELSGQQVFHWLPAPFDGLGAAANLTLQRARAETGVSWHPEGQVLPMMESPTAIANVQIFWTHDLWEGYAAWSRQSRFLEGIQDFGNNPYEQAYSFVDLTVRRRWGAVRGTAQIQNLFDAPTYWYTAGVSRGSSRAYTENGRTVTLSLDWVF